MNVRESEEIKIEVASLTGTGLQYKFTNSDNRLVKWVLERHSMTEAQEGSSKNKGELFFLGNNQVSLIWSSTVIK